MPIGAALEFRFATPAGTTGNSGPSSPGHSTGKWCSTVVIDDASMSNLFPEITGEERAETGPTHADYQCVFLSNTHATLTAANTVIWLSAETADVADIAIAVDGIAPTVIGSAAQQATVIADKDVAPVGVSAFSAPTTEGTGLAMGSLGPGMVKAFWIRRTVIAASDRHDDSVSISVSCDEELAA